MKPRIRPFQHATGSALSSVVVISFAMIGASFASLWTGAAADNNWDNLSNWDSNPTGGNGEVNNLTNTPIITGNNTLVPNDLKVAAATGASGRVDIRSGTFSINYWTFVGDWNGSGILNIADTSTTGGTYTGYGMGSASYDADNNGNANFMVGLYQSTGVVNMNTSGSLDVSVVRLSPNGQAGSGTFNLDNGTVNSAYEFQVGSDFWGANTASPAFLNMSGGTINAGSEFWSGGSGQGTTTMTGGTINSGSWFVVGRNNGSNGTFTMSGGTVNAATTTVGSFAVVGSFSGSQGTLNVNGGLFQTGGDRKMFIGETGTGTLNLSGTGHVLVNNNVTGDGFRLGVNTGSNGTVNLYGGTLEVAYIAKGAGTGTFNFNGGTLKVGSNHTGSNPLMAGLTTATVQSGGAVIDTNFASSAVISQSLLDGGGGGGLTKSGTGTLRLNGVNTYTGTTTITQGSLGGTGFIAGPVAIQSGAGLNFVNGSSTGTLTLQNGLALSDRNLLTFEVGGGTSDQVAITGGTYTAPTSPADVDVQVVGALGLGVHKLITGAPGINAADFNLVTSSPLGYDFALQVTGNDLELNVTSVSPAIAYWKGGVSGSWSTPDSGGSFNWAQDDTGASSTVTKPGVPSDVVFSTTGAANESTILDDYFTIKSLTFDESAGSVTITPAGTEELTVVSGITNNSANAQSISAPLYLSSGQTIATTTADLTLGASVTASADIVKTGAGTLNLAGTCYVPGLQVNGGILNPSGSLTASWLNIASGSTTGTVAFSSGTVNVSGVTKVGDGGNNTTTQTGTLNMTGGTWNNENDLIIGFAGAAGSKGTVNLSGGTMNVASSSLRWVILGNWDAVESELNVTGGGTLNLNAGTNIRARNSSGAKTINVDGGTIAGSFTGTDYYMWLGNGTLNVKNSGQITNWGRIDLGTGTVNLESNGSIQALGGVDAWEGWLNVKSGAVLQTAWLASGTGSTGGVVNIDNGTIRATGDNATFFNFWNNAAGVVIGGGGATIDTNGFTIASNKGFTGTGNLTKTGNGTLTMGGASTYAGSTTVNAGTLAVNGTSLSDSATLTINTGAVVNVTGTEVVGALDFGSGPVANGTYGATGSGAANIDDVHFSGTGVVSVGAGYSSWATLNGAGSQTMDQDHDNDGMPNGIEYFIGGPNGNTTGLTANPAPNSGTVTWPMGAGYTGAYGTDYEVQSSTDLQTWTQVSVGTGDNTVTVTPGTSVVYDMPAGGKSFVRLVVHN